jgi:glycogen synthase
MYRTQPEAWAKLVVTGMRQDWSWVNSARRYSELYASMMARNPVARERQGTSLVTR